MAIRVGNAAAPRWFDLSLSRLDDYIAFVDESGATSAELVLHAGPADERIARVHILEDDWFPVFERFHAHGIVCHVHAPLDPRFNLARWRSDRDGIQNALKPILRAVSTFAERQQGETTTFIVHAASGHVDEAHTRGAIQWLSNEFATASVDVRIALELRRPVNGSDARFDRRPASLAEFVASFNDPKLGICWDLVNDVDLAGIDNASPDRLRFLKLVNHVHLHDFDSAPRDSHHPLRFEQLLWRPALHRLISTGYDGAITLEVRYRHALSLGDPWQVLADSYNRLLSFLDSESTFRRGIQQGSPYAPQVKV